MSRTVKWCSWKIATNTPIFYVDGSNRKYRIQSSDLHSSSRRKTPVCRASQQLQHEPMAYVSFIMLLFYFLVIFDTLLGKLSGQCTCHRLFVFTLSLSQCVCVREREGEKERGRPSLAHWLTPVITFSVTQALDSSWKIHWGLYNNSLSLTGVICCL